MSLFTTPVSDDSNTPRRRFTGAGAYHQTTHKIKTMKRKISITLLSCAALAAFTPSLRAATTLLDNTSNPITSGSLINGVSWGSSTLVGLAFSTGSTAYNLRSIQFAPKGDGSFGTFTVSLYQGDAISQKPSGSALASQTFSGIAFESTHTSFTENLNDSFSLGTNTNYVLVLSTDLSDANIGSAEPVTTLDPGTSGLTYLGREFSFNGGISWGGPFASGTPWMKLTGTAVPEPSAFVMLGLGAIGLVARRRRVG